MKKTFMGWDEVAGNLREITANHDIVLNEGQKNSLKALAKRLPENGVIIADEVGMGKTRIAVAVASAVVQAHGRVAILVPPGLGYQWNDELQEVQIEAPLILRSLKQYLERFKNGSTGSLWFKEPVLVISHSFANWRLGGENTDPRRWTLLPEVYARYHKLNKERWPRGYCHSETLGDETICNAAESIVAKKDRITKRKLASIFEETLWPAALCAENYAKNSCLRSGLECVVGLGLGVFDLVIVDEAHKSRGADSRLSLMLEKIIQPSEHARHLAMTATPVELEATQWKQMLERIKVDKNKSETINEAILNYVAAVKRIRQAPNDEESYNHFKNSAECFKEKLTPYLLRRDKREEAAVIEFIDKSGEEYHAYRQEKEIAIETTRLSDDWKRAVCAAEALSFAGRSADTTAAKRLRLTFGNGHGIATLMDQLHQDDQDDAKQMELDNSKADSTGEEGPQQKADKRLARVNWWQKIMAQPFTDSETALFEHPAICDAIVKIEKVCQGGEKVLVFGKFTRPMRALVTLLNAREMLRCLDGQKSWPQAKISEGNQWWEALQVAHKQLNRPGNLDKDSLNAILGNQYQKLENKRQEIREELVKSIEDGFKKGKTNNRILAVFNAFKESVINDQGQNNDNNSLAIVAKAIYELLEENIEQAQPHDFARAFDDLITALSERDEGDTNNDGELDAEEASGLWEILRERLVAEYSRQEGTFARLMYGETKPETRRLLQNSFNRKQARLKVLVAQSLVGREGLNLHKACRTVILLHPEWNPGVVEQQIGRVDRLDSLWQEKLAQHEKGNGGVPRIEIYSIVFKGTYDEKNWCVLRERWDELRSQLHGVIISPNSNGKEFANSINKCAPKFVPN